MSEFNMSKFRINLDSCPPPYQKGTTTLDWSQGQKLPSVYVDLVDFEHYVLSLYLE